MALIPDPTRDKCIEAVSRIICSGIESGKLDTIAADDVAKYFSELYHRIYRIVSSKP